MSYLHIENLHRNQTILQCDEIFALEKVHGTSAHIGYKAGVLTFFSGGEKHSNFLALFDAKFLDTALASFGLDEIMVYGEAYGGRCQGMRETYGDELKFIVFDVKFNGNWLTVPRAADVARFLKLEFVDYVQIKADLKEIDAQRDCDSTQAIRNGMGPGKKREGVVLRPLEELIDQRGNRIIAKHKNAEFCETKTPRKVEPDKQKRLDKADEIAEEWVTPMRLQHVLDAAQAMLNNVKGLSGDTELDIKDTKIIIEIMTEDVKREAKGEIAENKEAMRAVGSRTAELYHEWLRNKLTEASNGHK